MSLAPLDIAVLIAYSLVILTVGLWVSRSKKGVEKSSKDYFLASKSLPWWAVGASLIAANISAEQFIGMSGSGFAVGLAIASYEWMAALTLIIVGKYFLPIFIEKGLYTIPEFLEKRYNAQVKSVLAVFWVVLFIFVNLTSVLYLGATALDTVVGNGDKSLLMYGIFGLALFTAAYSLWGGLSSVAWTDIIQVVLLVAGGLITTFIALSHVSPDETLIGGVKYIFERAPEKFDMILSPDNPEYKNLPGIAVLVGGMWIANVYYWGFNQYIIQRTFAAKSLKESQKGIIFAALLKMVIPIIVVVPGIIAYVIFMDNPDVVAEFTRIDGTIENDKAYPWLISNFVPMGLKGLVLAALAAAIVSSLASMLNSTATIFTMDIYKPLIHKEASNKRMVNVGRITGLAGLAIAIIVAPLLGGIDQAFQYIQEWTGIVSPGILAIFILGLFWKKTTARAAITGAILSVPVALYFKIAPKGWSDSALFVDLPFMHQMGLTFLITAIIMLVLSHFQNKGQDDQKGITLSKTLFKTSPTFNVLSFAVILLLVILYALFW
jgi:solute:Na+ symporter, SSS family